jgi:hypothetical protein
MVRWRSRWRNMMMWMEKERSAAMVTFTICRIDSAMMVSSSHQEGSRDVFYYRQEGKREVDAE